MNSETIKFQIEIVFVLMFYNHSYISARDDR